MQPHIVVTNAPSMDFYTDYVVLPKDYGTKAYFERKDIQAIYDTVFKNLDELDTHTGFSKKFASYEHLYVKPNLVSVYHNSGMKDCEYPESTDPRVFDAVIAYLKRINQNIIITESSGKPMPTRNSFKVAGYDRIASYHQTGLIAMELEPVVRYMLPKAEVMKEIYIPEIYKDIIDGKAGYISVPKLKTNIYTGVTLGFKNAMGCIPYALRERNHSHYINKKIADILYLFKPDLTIIDGIIGGEGNTPAPVDPVNSRVIISGTAPVETDEVATQIMGIDPDKIPLIIEAKRRGFALPETTISGDTPPQYAFRRASASLMADDFHEFFPNILVLAGHTLPRAPKISSVDEVTPEIARELEIACDGGCVNALRSGFEYVIYAPKQNKERPGIILIGSGISINGTRYWFDRDGKAYDEATIRSMKDPILTVGNCAAGMNDAATYATPGCCAPSQHMIAACSLMGIPFPLLSFKNKSFGHFGINAIHMVLSRSISSLRGKWIDCPSEHKDEIYPIPALSKEEMEKDYIYWPLPKMNWKTRLKMCGDQFAMAKVFKKK